MMFTNLIFLQIIKKKTNLTHFACHMVVPNRKQVVLINLLTNNVNCILGLKNHRWFKIRL